MDFELSDEQKALAETIREFVRRQIDPVAVQWEHEGRYPTELVEAMKSMGLFGMLVPAEFGGTDLDPVSYSLVFEELSRGWMGVAGILGSHTLTSHLIARFGTPEQKERWLPAVATGERRCGFALTEPDAGSDLQGIKTTARLEGDEYVVNGSKLWITNARFADPLALLVKTDPAAEPRHCGMSILMVEPASTEFTISRDLGKLGYKGPESCEVGFSDARVPAANLLGAVEGRGLQQALRALDYGRVNVAARAVGLAQVAYDRALAYARERHAFGVPIAEFQAVQHKLATMFMDVQAARLMTRWAASALAENDRSDLETGAAKVFASEVALRSALTSMRIHGAAGYSTELDIERLYRDAPLVAIGEGANDILLGVMAKHLLAAD